MTIFGLNQLIGFCLFCFLILFSFFCFRFACQAMPTLSAFRWHVKSFHFHSQTPQAARFGNVWQHAKVLDPSLQRNGLQCSFAAGIGKCGSSISHLTAFPCGTNNRSYRRCLCRGAGERRDLTYTHLAS